jgi:hypothetical protein
VSKSYLVTDDIANVWSNLVENVRTSGMTSGAMKLDFGENPSWYTLDRDNHIITRLIELIDKGRSSITLTGEECSELRAVMTRVRSSSTTRVENYSYSIKYSFVGGVLSVGDSSTAVKLLEFPHRTIQAAEYGDIETDLDYKDFYRDDIDMTMLFLLDNCFGEKKELLNRLYTLYAEKRQTMAAIGTYLFSRFNFETMTPEMKTRLYRIISMRQDNLQIESSVPLKFRETTVTVTKYSASNIVWAR